MPGDVVASAAGGTCCDGDWNTTPKPFVWTATADEILAKVRIVQTNIKKLIDNNAK